MISSTLALQRLKHCAQRIEEREIDIDIEYCIYLAEKCIEDTAIFLGFQEYLGDKCWVILVVRMYEIDGKPVGIPETVECRRTSQKCDKIALRVQKIERINAI